MNTTDTVTLIPPAWTYSPRLHDTITVPAVRAEFYVSRGYIVKND